jgi:hypothetical protein
VALSSARPALDMSTGLAGRTLGFGPHEAARMLLSFERPAHSRRLERTPSREPRAVRDLFADLENCTVANDTGITESRVSGSQITVKIVRAYGGCLGTKSR